MKKARQRETETEKAEAVKQPSKSRKPVESVKRAGVDMRARDKTCKRKNRRQPKQRKQKQKGKQRVDENREGNDCRSN